MDPANYDYWRIDTSKAGATWYLDIFMAAGKEILTPREWREFAGREENFICTEDRIPSHALKLFLFDASSAQTFTVVKEGCTHVRQHRLPLRPANLMDFNLSSNPFRAA